MNWTKITDAMPQHHLRVLIWMGRPIFGSYTPSDHWSFDFIQSGGCENRISHFCEVKGPAVSVLWTPISDFKSAINEDVILWCDRPVVAYQSSDENDPERDEDGWVMDYRHKGMGKPTHAMKVVAP